jgi:hypothetical protein
VKTFSKCFLGKRNCFRVKCDCRSLSHDWPLFGPANRLNTSRAEQSAYAYGNGFGSLTLDDSYWIGNEIIHQLTTTTTFILRIEVRLSVVKTIIVRGFAILVTVYEALCESELLPAQVQSRDFSTWAELASILR